jgi:hypothetical protein
MRTTITMNHDQPQPESQKPEEDLFDWAQSHTPTLQPQPESIINPQTEEEDDGLDETFKCTMCQNGGAPCPIHTVQRAIPKGMFSYEVTSSDDEINDELQLAANSSEHIQDFKTPAEALEYLKQLQEQNQPPEDKKAS